MKTLFTSLLILFITTLTLKAQSTQGLVAYYPFNGNTNDESGNGWNGTGTDLTLIQDRFSNANSAYYFNGSNSSIDFGYVPVPITNFSISVWINSNETGRGVVLLNAWLNRGFALEFLQQDGTISFEVLQSSSIANSISVPIANNSWHHIVATSDNDLVKLFFDGILIASQSGPTGTQSNEKLSAGFDHTIGYYYYDGGMDDIRIYNRVLNETEIQDLFHENGWGGRELNTIIITHGFTGEGLILPINPIEQTQWKHLRWQFAMADAVSDNRDIYLIRKGVVYPLEATYSQFAAIDSNSTVDYLLNNYVVPRAINPDKDNVLIFDWTLESAINVHGFAEAAADVLAATLVKLGTEYDFILDNLHFIGHSRGCVVNSEAIQRLIYWADNGILPGSITLDSEIHMTTLDPHPAGHWRGLWGFLVPMDDDRVNSFNIGVAGWKSGSYLTKYIDNYFETHFDLWQNPFKGLDYFPGLDTTSSSKTDLTTKLPIDDAHGLVHTWYFGTINTIANEDEFGEGPNIPRTEWYNSDLGTTEGFYYSRNRQGPLSDIAAVQNELKDVNSDSKLFSSGFILNGDFTDFERYTLNNNFRYNFPGWSYQDGVSSHLGGFFNPAARLSNSYPVLVHNSLYIPESSTECVFRMRVESPLIPYSIKDELEIYLDDILINSIPINSFELNYKWTQTNIPEIFRGKTCSLTFKIKKNNQSNDSRVDIDDIGLRYNSRISSTVACPVDFHIYDNFGNHTGPTSDTTYVEEIPGSEYYIYEDSTGDKIKTVYLEPIEGMGEYQFVIESQDSTSFFTYIIEDYSDTSRGTITFEFDSIAIEPNTVAVCTLNTNIQTPILEVDIDGDGTPDTTYTPIVITGIEDDQRNNGIISIPKEYSLSQNYPNPFNPTTSIKYSIPFESLVELKIFNILGQEISTLVNEQKPAGNYEVKFDASVLPSGVYFYRLQAGDFVQTRKMILLK